MPSNITEPAIFWKQFTGVPETLLHVRFGDQSSQLDLPAADLERALFDAESLRWTTLSSPDPDAEVLPLVIGTAIGKFLPDRAGLQQIQFDPAGFCKLMARGGGQWVEVWRSEKIDDVMTGLQTLTGGCTAMPTKKAAAKRISTKMVFKLYWKGRDIGTS